MRKKKNCVVVLLLVATLVLGIGYAAYTTTLTVNGQVGVSADVLDFTESVLFSTATTDNAAFGSASVLAGGQKATFETTGMTRAGETVEFTYVIVNKSEETDVNIEISLYPTTTAVDSKFTVTTALASDTIPAKGSTTATVTVVLREDVEVDLDDVAYELKYTATSIDEP